MSKLNDLLSNIITKLNSSVKVEPQELTEEQKAQARQNIGIARSDWNQNDESAPDYIKNRICYDKSYTVLEKTTIAFNDEGGAVFFIRRPIEEDKLYTITIDDAYTYDVVAKHVAIEGNEGIVIGDLGILIPGQDINNIPFIMIYLPPDTEPGEDAIMLTLFNPETYDPLSGVCESFTGDHGISIIYNDTKKIEKKFLPVMDWHANSNEEGYISNRPMYKTTKEFVWLDETQVEEGQSKATFNGFSDGWANVENVKVIFDGVECQSTLHATKDSGNSTELIDNCFVAIRSKAPDTGESIFGFTGWVYSFEASAGLYQFHKTGTIKIILTIAEYKTLPYEFENKAIDLGNDLLSTEKIAEVTEALRVGRRVYGKLQDEDVEVYYTSYCHESPQDYTWKCRSLDGMKQYNVFETDQYPEDYDPSNGKLRTITVTEAITAPETAQVGQTMAVKTVDDSGRPTEWEPIYPFQIITWEDDD